MGWNFVQWELDLIAMVTAGTAINSGSMAALANAANSNTYLSASSLAPTDYYGLSSARIHSQGVGYKLGENVTAGFPLADFSFQIVATNATGSVFGLRQTNFGQLAGSSGGTITLPITMTGGSGTGLQLDTSVGSLVDYSSSIGYAFPSYPLNYGYITDLKLGDGGYNYRSGDTLVFTSSLGNSSISASISSVDANGTIVSFTAYTPSSSAWPLPATLTNISCSLSGSTSSGSGALFNAVFMTLAQPQWLTELNRLRNNIDNSLADNVANTPLTTCISGPWPTAGLTDSYQDTNFYYSDAYGTGSVYVETSFFPFGFLKFTNYTPNLQEGFSGGNFTYWGAFPTSSNLLADSCENGFIIGGTGSVLVSGSFIVQAQCFRGGTDLVVGTSFPYSINTTPSTTSFASYVTATSTFPVAPTIFNITTGGGTVVYIEWDFNNVVMLPGIYSCSCKSNSPQIDDTDTQNGGGVSPGDYATRYDRVWFNSGAGMNAQGPLTTIRTESVSTPYPGISNTNPVWRIHIPGGMDFIGPGLGTYHCEIINADYGITNPTPLFSAPIIEMVSIITVGTNPQGLWSAYTQPVNDIAPLKWNQMPWNQTRTLVYGGTNTFAYNPMLSQSVDLTKNAPNNSYNNTLPVEQQIELPNWKNNTFFTKGFVIQDYNYNTQQCSIAGWSGVLPPTWSATVGANTVDTNTASIAVWLCTKNNHPNTSSLQANTYYPLGATVHDDVGCIRTNVAWFPGQNNGGSSSAATPFVTNNQNNYRPEYIGDPNQTAYQVYQLSQSMTSSSLFPNRWKLTTVSSSGMFISQPHSSNGLPNYPYYWYSETNPTLIPPLTSSGPATIWGFPIQFYDHGYTVGSSHIVEPGWKQSNQAYGYFVYSIYPRRIGNNFVSGTLLPMQNSSGSRQEISCQFGCMRNGSFVSFGSFTTGQKYVGSGSGVFWPIFTTDPLVYQCSERLDVQAVAIYQAGTGYSIPSTFAIPAALYNDTSTLIGLV